MFTVCCIMCSMLKNFLRPQRLLVMPWIRRLVAGLSLRRPDFYPSSAHVKFAVEKVALRLCFLGRFWFSLVSAIPSTFHNSLHLHVTLRIKKNGISEMGDHWTGKYLHFLQRVSQR
jgi:hypothetical protein